jgi:glutathione S-transferase
MNMLEDKAEGKIWLCGDRFSAADFHFYALMKMMAISVCKRTLLPGRENFWACWKRLDERGASQKAFQGFPA